MTATLAPAAVDRLRARLQPPPPAPFEHDWRTWLTTIAPTHTTHDYAPHHADFWDWVWSITPGRNTVEAYIAMWARGHAKSTSAELAVVALGARRRRRYLLYVCRTQDQADDHVQNIANLLESTAIERHYPTLADRMVGKHGNSKGWRVNRLRCANGFTVDAVGLDTAARGVKLDEQRPDGFILDDIDDPADSPETVAKNKRTITTGLLPAGTSTPIVLGAQNLIRADGIFADLAGLEVPDDTGRPVQGPTFLQDRKLSGPVPALVGMEHTTNPDTGKVELTAGEPTWDGFDLAECNRLVSRIGFTAFRSECQHDATDPAGGMFDHLEYRRCDEDDMPDLVSVAVAVDPAVTEKDGSDAHGIQADGLADDGRIYRLASIERRMTPLTAIRAAVELAWELGADLFVVEDDQGHDTWQSVYREAGALIRAELEPFEAQRFDGWFAALEYSQETAGSIGSKKKRASLMLAAYELGWFVHVRGDHGHLERSLNRFPKKKPFDLTDAAFWSARALRPEITELRPSRRVRIVDVGVAA